MDFADTRSFATHLLKQLTKLNMFQVRRNSKHQLSAR